MNLNLKLYCGTMMVLTIIPGILYTNKIIVMNLKSAKLSDKNGGMGFEHVLSNTNHPGPSFEVSKTRFADQFYVKAKVGLLYWICFA